MVTIPHSVSKILSTENFLLQLSNIVSCRRQSENTNSRIQAVKIWFLKFLSQIILIFFKQTNSLWHWCRNISGLEWFCCFHYCHQKRKDFFSLLQVVHLKTSKRRKTFRIIENSKWQFQHSSLFSRECGETVFVCYVYVYHIYLCIMCTQI